MQATNLNINRWQDLSIFGLRWLYILITAGGIYFWRSQTDLPDVNYNDILIPVGVGVVANLVFGASIFLNQLAPIKPMLIIVMDTILAGIFMYTALNVEFTQLAIVEARPSFLLLVTSLPIVTGFVRLGWMWGAGDAIGVLAAATGVIIYIYGAEQFDLLVDLYAIPMAATILLTLGTGLWVYARGEYGEKSLRKLMREAEDRTQQVSALSGRAHAITEMTTALTSTLNFEKILEAALDIGRLSLKQSTVHHTSSMVLLFRSYDDALYIASSRGLIGTDERRVIRGESGIIAQTLEDCVPIIGQNAWQDPELSYLGGFSKTRSMICIPLRAHYDNFGVLFFGSEEKNAFDPALTDTLYAVAVQATVALQNAVLYNSLLEEKERLIQMEEDARKALVRDLHDVPTQTISAVAMRLRIIMRMMERSPEKVMEELELVEGMTLRATEEIRHVLFKLRPLALESQGLIAALNQLAEKMQKTYSQNMTVKVGPDIEQYLDETQQGALFYLIEEATNNARKYAEANLLTVQVQRQDTVLFIRIADNGKGFDMETAAQNERGSFGMINMRERAEMLDGTLSIKSAPGRGTTILVRIPLDLQSRLERTNGSRSMIPTTKLAAAAKERLESY